MPVLVAKIEGGGASKTEKRKREASKIERKIR
jgi:hypothetical protein